MRTYLSIDCDYFSVSDKEPKESALVLLDILNILQLPVYVTVGHDLHPFDVNRHKVSRIINVDHHSDCHFSASQEIEWLWGTQQSSPLHVWLDAFREQTDSVDYLSEANWTHYCLLHGKNQKVEHWHQTPDKRVPETYKDESLFLIGGKAAYHSLNIKQGDLVRRITDMKKDIVAVGIAISPSWCERYTDKLWGSMWGMEFFDTLHQHHKAFEDTTLYSYFWGYDTAYCQDDKRKKLPQYKMPRCKVQLADNVLFYPRVRYLRYYSLVKGVDRVDIEYNRYNSCRGAIPHLPSIIRAAEAFSQW